MKNGNRGKYSIVKPTTFLVMSLSLRAFKADSKSAFPKFCFPAILAQKLQEKQFKHLVMLNDLISKYVENLEQYITTGIPYRPYYHEQL